MWEVRTACCVDKNHEPKTETVLVAKMVFVKPNSLGSQQLDKVDMTQGGDIKLLHDPFVKKELFENDWSETIGVPGGLFKESVVKCNFWNAYIVFVTLPHLSDCPVQHEVIRHNETGTFVSSQPSCTQYSDIVPFDER